MKKTPEDRSYRRYVIAYFVGVGVVLLSIATSLFQQAFTDTFYKDVPMGVDPVGWTLYAYVMMLSFFATPFIGLADIMFAQNGFVHWKGASRFRHRITVASLVSGIVSIGIFIFVALFLYLA